LGNNKISHYYYTLYLYSIRHYHQIYNISPSYIYSNHNYDIYMVKLHQSHQRERDRHIQSLILI